ncbi:MAG: branched-chain amino acid ABC transporter permease [Candidimonas sp.]
MIDFFITYRPVLDQILIVTGLAFSQYIALRAGVFSLAPAGFAALGAYTGAVLHMTYGWPVWLALICSTLMGVLAGALLSVPLARLRGVFQAIATLAFVQIIVSLSLYAESITGGAVGINGIPAVIKTPHLLAFFAVVTVFTLIMNRYAVGRAFDAIRQEETVAVALGISVVKYQALSFAISGGVAGLSGGLLAFNTYSITPEQFGFPMLILAIAAVVLGGRVSVWGPIVGAFILTSIPEIARPLAQQRLLVNGILLMLIIAYMPMGIVDTFRRYLAGRRQSIAGAAGNRREP